MLLAQFCICSCDNLACSPYPLRPVLRRLLPELVKLDAAPPVRLPIKLVMSECTLSFVAAVEAAVPPERVPNSAVDLFCCWADVFAEEMAGDNAWEILLESPLSMLFQKLLPAVRLLSPRLVAKPARLPVAPMSDERVGLLPPKRLAKKLKTHLCCELRPLPDGQSLFYHCQSDEHRENFNQSQSRKNHMSQATQ